MVSVSVCYLFYQPMDGKNKTWTLRFPAKETLIWRRHCSIDQSCCSMTSKQFLESSSGMKFVYPSVRLANQNPGAFVSVRYTYQIALFPFVCCFCFVRAFSFQGHTKIAVIFEIYMYFTTGTLPNYDDDCKENVKKAIDNSAHLHHAFLYISLLSLHNYDVKLPNFKFTRERERQGDKFYHLCLNSSAVPSLQPPSKFPSFK